MKKNRMFTMFLTLFMSAFFLISVWSETSAQTPELRRILGNAPARLQNEDHVSPSAVSVARLHYSGGGDWYWGGSAL
ncbi:MAG: hypothetical protein GY865_11260, partial [candidate division Zixibacteria bacterium]|nr:hypothetical protein [candidate division Zixibacteria bacterium]